MSKRAAGEVSDDVERLRKELRRIPRSAEEIAGLLGVDIRTARRYLTRLVDAGDDVSRVGIGRPVRYQIGT